MAEDESQTRLLADLAIQLALSRQQQARLKEALSRVIGVGNRAEGPR